MLASRMSRMASSPTMKGLLAAERLRSQGSTSSTSAPASPTSRRRTTSSRPRTRAIDGELHQVHGQRRARRPERGDCRRYAQGLRRRLHAGRGHRHRRRQAGAGQRRAGAVRPGRRGDHARAGLADDRRADQAGRGHAGDRARPAPSDGFTLTRRAVPRRDHAAHQGHRHQLAGEPDRRADHRRRADQAGAGRQAKGLWIVLDLCYERLIYEPVPHNLPGVLLRELRERRSVLCGSASKAYAMTGWRCGWAIAPKEVIAACGALQSHQTSNVCSITQRAVVAALTGPQDCVTAMLDEYRSRRDQVLDWLTADPRIKCVKPAGAFYLFIDIAELLAPSGVRTSAEFAERLIEESYVVTTAGEAFDAPGFLRISYANSLERLKEACDRLSAFVKKYEAVAAGARRALVTPEAGAFPTRVDAALVAAATAIVGADFIRDDDASRLRYGTDALKRGQPRRRRRHPRHDRRGRGHRAAVRRGPRAAGAARRRHRLHRRRGAAAGRRRAVDGALRSHPRDRRGQPAGRRAARRDHRRRCRTRSRRAACSIRPIRPACASAPSAATSPSAPAVRARSSTARRAATSSASKRCCRRRGHPHRRQVGQERRRLRPHPAARRLGGHARRSSPRSRCGWCRCRRRAPRCARRSRRSPTRSRPSIASCSAASCRPRSSSSTA